MLILPLECALVGFCVLRFAYSASSKVEVVGTIVPYELASGAAQRALSAFLPRALLQQQRAATIKAEAPAHLASTVRFKRRMHQGAPASTWRLATLLSATCSSAAAARESQLAESSN